jgi:hypothetical protein
MSCIAPPELETRRLPREAALDSGVLASLALGEITRLLRPLERAYRDDFERLRRFSADLAALRTRLTGPHAAGWARRATDPGPGRCGRSTGRSKLAPPGAVRSAALSSPSSCPGAVNRLDARRAGE